MVSTAFPTAAQIARANAVPRPGPAADAQARAAASAALGAILADAGGPAVDAEPVALRTVLQADGDVALLIDSKLADGDQHLLRALVQVHTAPCTRCWGRWCGRRP